MPKSDSERFDQLETLIERGFAALASDVADNKTEIASVKTEVGSIRAEVADLRESPSHNFMLSYKAFVA